MKNRMTWLVLSCFVVTTLMLASHASAAPRGKCVYVSSSPNFYMTGLDWMTGTGHVAVSIKNLLSDALVAKALDGKIIPALAKSWELSPNGLSITFNLDKNAKFHNGATVTAEDIKFSLERMMRPELKQTFGKELRDAVKRLEVVDDHHLVVHFEKLYPAFFDRCAEYWGIGPKKYIEKIGDKALLDRPIGCGPFKLVKFNYNAWIEAEAVPDHYRKPPEIKNIRLAFVAENATRMAMLKTGEADIITLSGTQLPEIKTDPKLRLVTSPYAYLDAFEFYDYHNKTPGPFDDIRVRQAADYAIDRKAICDKVLNGAAQPYRGILAPYHAGFNPALEKPTKYNPEKAKKLLIEAGYPRGFTVDLYCNINRKAYTPAIAGYLLAVGIKTNMKVLEHGAFKDKRWGRTFNGCGVSTGAWWVGRTHPAVALQSFQNSENPWAYSATPEITKLVVKCQQAVGEKAIAEAAGEIAELYDKQYSQLTLWTPSYPMGVGPKVEYVEGVAGWPFPSAFEFIRMK
ncbi:MAG: ABC transporter substrate-binding protein [Desulfobacteraceae bacterium]|nr:ABC transporter substrate-binding protein [Desulfobacteraceae bacterium]